MSSLKHTVKKLQKRNSRSHVFMLVIFLVICFIISLLCRYYVVEPIKMENASMYPRHKENSTIWFCKLPQCINKVKKNETVWAKMRNQESLVRKIIGMPGDTLKISAKGRVISGKLKYKWKKENAFIENRSMYIPKQGDTINIIDLNDVEQDYIISLMHEQGIEFYIKTTLWQGDRELNVDRIGSTKLANRQVSLQEIDMLPWQDRYLIELQIRQNEPGNAPIKIKRELFNSDSILIQKIIIEEDCYFLACERGSHCVDSRETGYFTKSRLLGSYLPYPDKVKEFLKEKIKIILKP